jgi:hypothetical protein
MFYTEITNLRDALLLSITTMYNNTLIHYNFLMHAILVSHTKG